MRICERLAHKRPVFSFEFFPPKSPAAEKTLWKSLEQLAVLRPDFVSVTYGAGGSTRERTLDLVTQIKSRLGIETVAHLTCVGSSRDEIAAILDKLAEHGVCNVLALRGDPPRGESGFTPAADGFRYASELVEFIASRGDFCIGAACYPEKHPEAADLEEDIRYLKQKVDAGADFLVTQMFFDNRAYFDFVARIEQAGINTPVLPGIMPVTNVKQSRRISELCGSALPEVLETRLRAVEGDPHEEFWTGVSYAAYQCRELLLVRQAGAFEVPEPGVPGIHFYTLNRSPATRAIFEMLRLSHAAS